VIFKLPDFYFLNKVIIMCVQYKLITSCIILTVLGDCIFKVSHRLLRRINALVLGQDYHSHKSYTFFSI